jgi:hypothetical protein
VRKRLDLAIGVVLGLLLGLAVAFLLIVVIGGGRDASSISTDETRPAPTRPEAPRQAPPRRP